MTWRYDDIENRSQNQPEILGKALSRIICPFMLCVYVSCKLLLFCTFQYSFVCETSPVCLVQSSACARLVCEGRLQRQDGGAHASTLVYVNKGKKASFRRWCYSFHTFVRRNGAESK